ncbi:TPR repeat-containing protein C19B12.01 [Sarocladium implicatum]|nr:TPR repeat-containing protein C19B12.01 [Sarocladium implicatum]
MATESTMEGSSLATLHTGAASGSLIDAFAAHVKPESSTKAITNSPENTAGIAETIAVGLAALDAFLQANVTGPVLPSHDANKTRQRILDRWSSRWNITEAGEAAEQFRRACLRYLEIDGVAPYAYMPHPELFCLAKYIFTSVLAKQEKDTHDVEVAAGVSRHSLAWMQLRVNIWHYKLLTQPTLGSGSNFTRSSQWSEVPSLATSIQADTEAARKIVLGDEVWAADETWTTDDKVQFLVEVSNNYILLGRADQAREALAEATRTSGLAYALSGALGKRTKFQQSSTSQLVVLAKSRDAQTEGASAGGDEEDEDRDGAAKPDALKLNDDTLLEDIHFTKEENGNGTKTDALPSALAALSPESQPQLNPLDQIILLTEATLRDAFSPSDDLTSEEVLPYAVRVIADKSTNWQIYTQALLVRSRIELHRSRTVERGVLQLQAVADQVLTDMTSEQQSEAPAAEEKEDGAGDVPSIEVTTPSQQTSSLTAEKPTSFLPAPKATESAPASVRLRYIHTLSSPPRWHLESELAYAWAGVGSLSSALEIFKRLRLWAEVALCLASAAASEDEQGRGAGGEAKAKGIVRWRLFHRTGSEAIDSSNPDDEVIEDVTTLRAHDFSGPERTPPPPNAARLWCILGDLEDDPSHYTRAWEISNGRYARAQKSLGEHYLKQKDPSAAREAYRLATRANRLSPDLKMPLRRTAGRLEAPRTQQVERTQELGATLEVRSGAFTLKSQPRVELQRKPRNSLLAEDEEDVVVEVEDENGPSKDPEKLLTRSLTAYKKGASIAHDNWRIWDNVLTLCTRIHPIPVPDIVLALKHIIRIRKTENALDADLLTALLRDQVLSKEKTGGSVEGVYEPPRGSMERLVTRLLEEEVVPLITHRADLWSIISRLRGWRADHTGAIEAAESAWRCAVGVSSSSLEANTDHRSGADWTVDKGAWEDVVRKTDELASMLENWGPSVEGIGGKWKGRVRSAVRTVMGRGRENWEGSEGWATLEGIMEGLKANRE